MTATLLALVVLAGCSVARTGGSEAENPSSETNAPAPEAGSGAGSEWVPSEENQDPAKDIEGVVVTEYEPLHALEGQRVAYEKAPPDGGRHAPVWANCNGTVYEAPVRNEQMVHALEHGAIWIAYDAAAVRGDDLATLTELADGQPYLLMSPYPGLDLPISLQAWGHQLKLTEAGDPRIGQFVAALRENQYTSPEPGARCDSDGTGFDVTNPPPFEAAPPGPDAAPVGGP